VILLENVADVSVTEATVEFATVGVVWLGVGVGLGDGQAVDVKV
jgi:hypothetical protein